MEIGDRIKVEKNGTVYEGILIPSTTGGIVIKLDNGYNIGFKRKGVTLSLVKKKDGTKEKVKKFKIKCEGIKNEVIKSVKKNLPKISAEAFNKFNKKLNRDLTLVILAPDEYWRRYLQNKSAGDWLPEIKKISKILKDELNIEIILLAMTDSEFDMGLEGMPAKLTGNCDLVSVETLALAVQQ